MLNLIVMSVLLLQAPPIDEKKVQELVARFGSEDIAVREAATTELLAMGEGVLPLLEKMKDAPGGETKARIEKVIDELAGPERWAKRWVEEDTNGRDQGFEQALRTKEMDRRKAARIVSGVLLHESATAAQKQYMLNLAVQHRLFDVWPAILQLLARDDPGSENYVHMLRSLRPPREAAPALLKAIPKVQEYNVAYQLLELARALKPDRAAMEECIGAILDGDDINLEGHALSMLQYVRTTVSPGVMLKWWRTHPQMRTHPGLREAILRAPPGDAVDDVLELLKSTDPEDVQLAIDLIGRQKIVTAAAALLKAGEESPELMARVRRTFQILRCEEEVRKWIAGQGGPGRRAAIALAAELRWAAATPEVALCLEDTDPSVRREAAPAAGALRFADAVPGLEALLRDRDGGVRRAALLSLAMLGKKEATTSVLEHLRSDDPDLQAAAVESLPFVDADQALAALTTDEAMERAITRHALAVLIVRGGPGTLHRVMARAGARLSAEELHARIRLIQSVPGR